MQPTGSGHTRIYLHTIWVLITDEHGCPLGPWSCKYWVDTSHKAHRYINLDASCVRSLYLHDHLYDATAHTDTVVISSRRHAGTNHRRDCYSTWYRTGEPVYLPAGVRKNQGTEVVVVSCQGSGASRHLEAMDPRSPSQLPKMPICQYCRRKWVQLS